MYRIYIKLKKHILFNLPNVFVHIHLYFFVFLSAFLKYLFTKAGMFYFYFIIST